MTRHYHLQPRPTRRQMLLSSLIALGLLCHHSVSIAPFVGAAISVPDIWGSDKLLNRWREVRSVKAEQGGPPISLFELAFTATYTTKDTSEVGRTLDQFTQLLQLLEAIPQPNATHLAFIPELGNAAALEIIQQAVNLAKDDNAEPTAIALAFRSISGKLRAATPWRGYPATRRILIGTLLKKRLDLGGRFPTDLEAAAEDILLQLFQLHKVSAANRGAVQFFHISKSGGTNLCQAAGANGCTSQGFDTRTNCLIRDFSDQPRWVSYTAHKYVQYRMSSRQALPWFVNFHSFRPPYTCTERRAYLLSQNLSFYANEYTNPPVVPAAAGSSFAPSQMCEDFVNLIMFRNPYDRLRSQIGWVQKLYKEFYMDVDTQQAFVNRTTGFWERLMPAGVNNYYIRSLLGQRFFEFPVIDVARAHLLLAKLAALQHDILLTLESMTRNELALRLGLGWSQALQDGAVRSSSELGEEPALPLDYDTMLERNVPDVELYGFAREMQTLDTVLWNFAAAVDAQAQKQQQQPVGSAPIAGTATDSAPGQCGYVSLGSPEVVAERAERLREAGVIVAARTSVAGATNGTSSDAEDSTALLTGAEARAAGVGESARRGGSNPDTSTSGVLIRLGESLRRPGTGGVNGGRRGPSVVTIARRAARRLQRLKGLKAAWHRRGD